MLILAFYVFNKSMDFILKVESLLTLILSNIKFVELSKILKIKLTFTAKFNCSFFQINKTQQNLHIFVYVIATGYWYFFFPSQNRRFGTGNVKLNIRIFLTNYTFMKVFFFLANKIGRNSRN